MPKDNIFIKHDYNASADPKIKNMRLVYGWEGFGWYWHIVETMRCETDYRLEYSELIFGSLADDFKCKPEKVKDFIDHCINTTKLFQKNGTHFFSARLLRDMEKLEQIRRQNKEAGEKSGEARRKAKEQSFNETSTTDEPPLNNCSDKSDKPQNYEQTKQVFNGRLADVELIVVVDKVRVVYKDNKEKVVVVVDEETATTVFKLFEENISKKLTPYVKIGLVLDIAYFGEEKVKDVIILSGSRAKDNFAYVHKTLMEMENDKQKKKGLDSMVRQ